MSSKFISIGPTLTSEIYPKPLVRELAFFCHTHFEGALLVLEPPSLFFVGACTF